MSAAPDPIYSARLEQFGGTGVARLRGPSGACVSIVPKVGNTAVEFLVNGKNAFWFPHSSIAEFATGPELCGNPFLAPWANRLDEHAFYANGIRYELNRGLGNYSLDPSDQPIHGLLLYADQWEVADLRSGAGSARVTSRLEFGHYPSLMAQFPFAHSIEMTCTTARATRLLARPACG